MNVWEGAPSSKFGSETQIQRINCQILGKTIQAFENQREHCGKPS